MLKMLEKYNEKRDFDITNEPKGKIKKTKSKRFVVQFHEARRDHYDFRLEHNGVLVSFAVPKGFSYDSSDKRLAVHVEDHPLDYINFEGVIPKGQYGAGRVQVWDKGTYAISEDLDLGLKKGNFKVYLKGEKLKGVWSIVHFKEENWLVIFDKKFNNLENTLKNSLKNEKNTKKSLKIDKNSKKLPFKKASAQLATLSKNIPKGKEWLFEIKYDGYRIVSYIQNGKVKLLSRKEKDYTKNFPKISDSLKNLADNAVLDGEMVVFDENGRSDFSLMQESIKKHRNNFYYVVFDILALNGEDLREKELQERRKVLENLSKLFTENIILSQIVEGKGKECFALAKKLGLEGIVAKNKTSTYHGKRDDSWLKIKCYQRQEYVIGGFLISDIDNKLSALLVGYFADEKLFFIGKVGTGFSEEIKEKLLKKLKKIEVNSSPFQNYNKKAFYVEPKFIAEVQYAELAASKVLRQASFIGLREDKEIKDVRLEEE